MGAMFRFRPPPARLHLGLVCSAGLAYSIGFACSVGLVCSVGLAYSIGFACSVGLAYSIGFACSVGLVCSVGFACTIGLACSVGVRLSVRFRHGPLFRQVPATGGIKSETSKAPLGNASAVKEYTW